MAGVINMDMWRESCHLCKGEDKVTFGCVFLGIFVSNIFSHFICGYKGVDSSKCNHKDTDLKLYIKKVFREEKLALKRIELTILLRTFILHEEPSIFN